MSIVHLNQLRTSLVKDHWVITEELPGNDYDISGCWKIARPNGDSKLTIEFEGLNDMKTLPVESSYGCRVGEHPHIVAYFSRVNRSWPRELEQFIRSLNEVNMKLPPFNGQV